jgi:hypothetical protein
MLFKLVGRCIDIAEKELAAKDTEEYDARLVMRKKKELDAQRKVAVEQLKLARYFYKQIVDGVPEGWTFKKIAEVAGINENNLSKSFYGIIEYIDIASVTTASINQTTKYEFEDAPGRAGVLLPMVISYGRVYVQTENHMRSFGIQLTI